MIVPADSPGLPLAADVCRGVSRLFHAHALAVLMEVPLPNGRRADLMAVDVHGRITIVEVKVARADLLGDMKWLDYLEYCDRFFWAIPPDFDAAPLDREAFLPMRSGIIIADRYEGTIVREAPFVPLAAARRKAETLRFARRAAGRVMALLDSDLVIPEGW